MSDYSMNKEDFCYACGNFPTGVTVTTVISKDGMPHGVTVSSFTSVSLDPPLVLVCIDHRSQIQDDLCVDQCFGVNILNQEQQELSRRFARNWADRFAGVEWYSGRAGVPVLNDATAVFECQIVTKVPAGDHVVIVGRVLYTSTSERLPLLYLRRSYGTEAYTSAKAQEQIAIVQAQGGTGRIPSETAL